MELNRNYFDHWAGAKGSDYKFTRIFNIKTQQSLCLKYSEQLEPFNVNVLTTRLCLTQEMFLKLFELRLNYRQKLRDDYKTDELKYKSVSGMPAPSLVPTEGLGEVIEILLIEPYKNLYSFCSFFASTLDRLAFEINILYDLGINISKIDWRKFGSDQKRTPKEGSKRLLKKNKELEKILRKFDFNPLLKYRDILEHRGSLEIKNGNIGKDFDFFIPENPELPTSNFNIAVVEYCKGQFINILHLCEDIYSEICKDTSNR